MFSLSGHQRGVMEACSNSFCKQIGARLSIEARAFVTMYKIALCWLISLIFVLFLNLAGQYVHGIVMYIHMYQVFIRHERCCYMYSR